LAIQKWQKMFQINQNDIHDTLEITIIGSRNQKAHLKPFFLGDK
jgi:hypothetical protein